VAAADNGPRTGVLPTDPFLVNGPAINTAELERLYPRTGGQLLRNTGATWDSPDRRTPYNRRSDGGFRATAVPRSGGERGLRALAGARHAHGAQPESAASDESNRGVVHVAAYRQFDLVGCPRGAAVQVRGLRPFTANVNQYINAGRLDYDAVMFQMKKRFSHNYSTQVSYTFGKSNGNTSGNGAAGSNFQVADDLHLDLNEGPTDFDIRHQLHAERYGAHPADRRSQCELGRAGAERHAHLR